MDDHRDGGRGFRQIGSLVPRTTNGRSPSMGLAESGPTRSPQNTSTIGSTSQEIGGAKFAGGGHGETASGRSLAIAEAARQMDPEAVDRAIVASLPPSIASTLRPTYRDRIDPVYGFDTEFVGYRLDGPVPAKDLMQARQMVGLYLAPAEVGLIKREIARLRVSTKSRAETDDDLAMGFQVLAEECAQYPADVVVWALRTWAQAEIFYPSLAEIRERLQRGARKRRALLEAMGAQGATA